MMSEPRFRCKICNKFFNAIPDNAVKLGRSGTVSMYEIDGAIHALVSIKVGRRKTEVKESKA